jgi:hypothetical protein
MPSFKNINRARHRTLPHDLGDDAVCAAEQPRTDQCAQQRRRRDGGIKARLVKGRLY